MKLKIATFFGVEALEIKSRKLHYRIILLVFIRAPGSEEWTPGEPVYSVSTVSCA